MDAINVWREKRVCKECGNERALGNFKVVYYRVKTDDLLWSPTCIDCQTKSKKVVLLEKINRAVEYLRERKGELGCCGCGMKEVSILAFRGKPQILSLVGNGASDKTLERAIKVSKLYCPSCWALEKIKLQHNSIQKT